MQNNHQNINIVFMGTPEFAVPSLDVLLQNNFNVVGVITAPDKPAGRGQKMNMSPVKKFALKHQLKVLQPVNLKDPTFIDELKVLKPDMQIVVAFRMLPEVVWALPPLGTFNLHASLLPQYRGAAPINHVIINGEKETGLTTFILKKEIDTGDILFQEKTHINPHESAGDLHDRLMLMGPDLVLKTVKSLLGGQVSAKPQSQGDHCMKLAPKIYKKDCQIKWDQPAEKVYNFIRGLSPYPASYTFLSSPKDKKFQVKLFQVRKVTNITDQSSGSILSDGKNYLNIFCQKGCLSVIEIQIEGKRRMFIEDFLRGFKIDNDWKCV